MEVELAALDEMVEAYAFSMQLSAAEVICPLMHQFPAIHFTPNAETEHDLRGSQGDVRSTTSCEQVRSKIRIGDLDGAILCLRTHCPAAVTVSAGEAVVFCFGACFFRASPIKQPLLDILVYITTQSPTTVQKDRHQHGF